MFARILGTTALALVLAAPAGIAGQAPVAPQSMEPRDVYPQAQEMYDREMQRQQADRYGAERLGEGHGLHEDGPPAQDWPAATVPLTPGAELRPEQQAERPGTVTPAEQVAGVEQITGFEEIVELHVPELMAADGGHGQTAERPGTVTPTGQEASHEPSTIRPEQEAEADAYPLNGTDPDAPGRFDADVYEFGDEAEG